MVGSSFKGSKGLVIKHKPVTIEAIKLSLIKGADCTQIIIIKVAIIIKEVVN